MEECRGVDYSAGEWQGSRGAPTRQEGRLIYSDSRRWWTSVRRVREAGERFHLRASL